MSGRCRKPTCFALSAGRRPDVVAGVLMTRLGRNSGARCISAQGRARGNSRESAQGRLWPLLVIVGAALLAADLHWRPAQAATFATSVSGFEHPVAADSQGRILQPRAARLRRLAPDRWLAVDFEAQTSRWFDDAGKLLHEGPYVEIRSGEFRRHPADPDRSALFSAWSKLGTALLRADGSVFLDWQGGSGEWSATDHPQRYRWRLRRGGERIFAADGTLRLAVPDDLSLVAGPFARQALYLLCDFEQACELRDEAGEVRWRAQVTDLAELQDGRWLGRRGNVWFVMDAQGQLSGDRIYVGGWPATNDRSPPWPFWTTQYRLSADGSEVRPDSAANGFLHDDGSFDAVPQAVDAHPLCPGTWRLRGAASEPRYWLSDGRGQRIAEHSDRGWHTLEHLPGRYLAYTADERSAVVDCQGRRLFDAPDVQRLTPLGPGFAATLAGESQPRLWLDAELRRQLLPADSAIQAAGPDGRLLLVARGEVMRLYDGVRGAFVGEPFTHAKAPLAQGLVFNRDGWYGFMDVEGRERLAPQYVEITLWGEDRLWSRRYVGQGSVLGLHRLDGSLIGSWSDALAKPLQTWQGAQDTQAVAQVYGKTYRTAQGAYFPQQWVDRNGRVLMTALQCPGADVDAVLASGAARLEPAVGDALLHGGDCRMPEAIRAAIRMRPADRP